MREFRAYEDVGGDVKVYVKEQDQGDDAWRELGNVDFECRRKRDTITIAKNLKADPPLTPDELTHLSIELAWPRRW